MCKYDTIVNNQQHTNQEIDISPSMNTEEFNKVNEKNKRVSTPITQHPAG